MDEQLFTPRQFFPWERGHLGRLRAGRPLSQEWALNYYMDDYRLSIELSFIHRVGHKEGGNPTGEYRVTE